MPQKRSRTYSYVFDIVVIFAVVVLLANFGNYFNVVYPVEGVSMQPTIVQGDLAVVQPVPISSVHVGDIVVYKDGLIDVIHRVIRISDSGGTIILTVKGDNNPSPDPVSVTSSLLVGKVVAVVLYLGNFVTQPFNYLLAIVLIALLIVDYLDSERARTAATVETSPPAIGTA